jgi:8-oxo-dGTP pyrophosphatase MutT (NUDIX family)
LLQKRSSATDTFPNRLDSISSAGHLDAGADPRETAVREVMEELGLAIKPDSLEFALTCPAEQAPFGGCNAYEHVYFFFKKENNVSLPLVQRES